MILTDRAQEARYARKDPIRVGVIGTGEMGRGIVNQVTRYAPGITVAAVYNRTISKALESLAAAGISDVKIVDNLADFESFSGQGKIVVCQEVDLILESSHIDLVIEVTGTIEFAAKAILKAFELKKHVLSFNAELDSTLGPILKHMSIKHGVLYSVGDGDQPGVTMNLYRYVKGMGFEPLLCGNIKGLEDRRRTPATQAEFARKWGMTPEMVTSFADGTKISFEQSCIANATRMKVAVRGMFGYRSSDHIDNLKHLYDVDQLRELGGIVDYVVGAQPSPGIFIYAATNDPIAVKYLRYGKLGDGPLYSFYTPYHLLFFDIASSIVRLMDFGDIVIAPLNGPVVEVIAIAKKELFAGEPLDGLGGFSAYGICENTEIVRKENLLPMGLINGIRLKRNITIDQPITLNDVDIPQDHFVFDLYKQQLALFPV